MKRLFLMAISLMVSCNKEHKTLNQTDTIMETNKTVPVTKANGPGSAQAKSYANARFREVTVENQGSNTFRVRGEGQIFEASFGWVVEDGHNELKKGFAMTDAGAPDWGRFDFTVEVVKKQANSSLTLLLFETSAEDGSRQYELPIPLQ